MDLPYSKAEHESRVKRCESVPLWEYIRDQGFKMERRGNAYFTLSPWTDERTPSLVVYSSSNRFMDFSSGKRGNIIDFVRYHRKVSIGKAISIILKESSEIDYPVVTPFRKTHEDKRFYYSKYLAKKESDRRMCYQYANSRGIPVECYKAGIMPVYSQHEQKPIFIPSLLFIHQNGNGLITGVKARLIDFPDQRWTSRGKLNFYILENDKGLGAKRIYITESETSSASLYNYLKSKQVRFVIICVGGVNSQILDIPEKYRNLDDRYLVIDYDGDEELYQERVQNFEHLNVKDVKIPVEKGEDINSLCMKGMIDKYQLEILK